MSYERITIKNVYTNQVLASAEVDKGVRFFEGAWYFDAELVDMSQLVVTERTYVCPYKGVCYWIDLVGDTAVEDVAFTYFEINAGYEFVHNRIAFYAGRREGTYEESEEIVVD